jgi:hypothetical protein
MAGLDPANQQARVTAPMSRVAPQTRRGWVGGSVAAHGERTWIPADANML